MAARKVPAITIEMRNAYQKVILNRPTRKNAITPKMYEELSQILDDSAKNGKVNIIVITGAGDFFSSGFDLMSATEIIGSSGPGTHNERLNGSYKCFVDSVIKFPKLLVGVVNGPAIGIMATVLALFDIVYASDKAYFQTPFSKFGFTAEGCSTYTFPRIMGSSKAGDMLYFSHKMSAIEAEECGLVSRVYPHNKLHEVWRHLDEVADLSTQSMLLTKQLIKKWDQKKLLDINAAEAETLLGQWENPDFIERITMFLSRKSKF